MNIWRTLLLVATAIAAISMSLLSIYHATEHKYAEASYELLLSMINYYFFAKEEK